MAGPRIVAVVGATGAQGGGLVRAILGDADSSFRARALTRRPAAEAARSLAARGAEVVCANLDDVASLERAFAGAYAAFCVTNFWEHFSPERELVQARAMAEAARSTGLQHVIWSTLEDTRRWMPVEDARMPTLMGRYKVPHFDAKGEADAAFTGVPTTFMRTSFYWDNFVGFPGMGPCRGPDGRLRLVLPIGHAAMPSIAGEDIGRCAYGVLQSGSAYIGQTIGIAGAHLTGEALAAGLGRGLGELVEYVDVTPDAYRELSIPGAAELANMFQFKRDFEDEFRAVRSVPLSKTLNPGLKTFDEWLAVNGRRIQVR
jgi:uncharacterized protein YbjT (DUF2867 family)